MGNRPGGELAKRPLQFFWIVDCSGSMQGKKMEQVNFAISEAIKPMRDVADENPNAQVFVRAIKFADAAQWHVSQPTDIHDFTWVDLDAEDGCTRMGDALEEVAKALETNNMPERGLPPVLVLITDGYPTDDFNAGLKALFDRPWGKKAVRIAVAIGEDADLDQLQKFIGHSEIKPLVAHNAPDLAKKIRFASTVPIKAASNPATRPISQADNGHVPIPAPPQDTPPASAADMW